MLERKCIRLAAILSTAARVTSVVESVAQGVPLSVYHDSFSDNPPAGKLRKWRSLDSLVTDERSELRGTDDIVEGYSDEDSDGYSDGDSDEDSDGYSDGDSDIYSYEDKTGRLCILPTISEEDEELSNTNGTDLLLAKDRFDISPNRMELNKELTETASSPPKKKKRRKNKRIRKPKRKKARRQAKKR